MTTTTDAAIDILPIDILPIIIQKNDADKMQAELDDLKKSLISDDELAHTFYEEVHEFIGNFGLNLQDCIGIAFNHKIDTNFTSSKVLHFKQGVQKFLIEQEIDRTTVPLLHFDFSTQIQLTVAQRNTVATILQNLRSEEVTKKVTSAH
jgi:hypothetical protein